MTFGAKAPRREIVEKFSINSRRRAFAENVKLCFIAYKVGLSFDTF